ncbi:hypothetical protein [Sphingomonas glacialis]|uniref:hypothetical protein n=1 Tax=Sphingomonas glacialis TaxID=658225 RepID=UPI00112BB170|nr:hypothetical protein [Sphingomonas glacialis]
MDGHFRLLAPHRKVGGCYQKAGKRSRRAPNAIADLRAIEYPDGPASRSALERKRGMKTAERHKATTSVIANRQSLMEVSGQQAAVLTTVAAMES